MSPFYYYILFLLSNFLRKGDCKYREFAAKSEISKFFIILDGRNPFFLVFRNPPKEPISHFGGFLKTEKVLKRSIIMFENNVPKGFSKTHM